MKFKCSNPECGKLFLYAAKKTVGINSEEKETGALAILGKVESELPVFETHVCPFCKSLEFEEYAEPQPEIVSVKSVPLEDVDEWLARGYVVESLYARTATIVKREAQGDYVAEVLQKKKELEQCKH